MDSHLVTIHHPSVSMRCLSEPLRPTASVAKIAGAKSSISMIGDRNFSGNHNL